MASCQLFSTITENVIKNCSHFTGTMSSIKFKAGQLYLKQSHLYVAHNVYYQIDHTPVYIVQVLQHTSSPGITCYHGFCVVLTSLQILNEAFDRTVSKTPTKEHL